MKVVSVDAAGLLHAMRIQSVRSSVLGTSVQVFHKDFPLSCVPPVSTVKLSLKPEWHLRGLLNDEACLHGFAVLLYLLHPIFPQRVIM